MHTHTSQMHPRTPHTQLSYAHTSHTHTHTPHVQTLHTPPTHRQTHTAQRVQDAGPAQYSSGGGVGTRSSSPGKNAAIVRRESRHAPGDTREGENERATKRGEPVSLTAPLQQRRAVKTISRSNIPRASRANIRSIELIRRPQGTMRGCRR